MRKLRALFFLGVVCFAGMLFSAGSETCPECEVIPKAISSEQFDRIIEGLEKMRQGNGGIKLSADERKQVDETLAEMKKIRATIPPGGSYKIPTPKDTLTELETLKKTPEYAKLPAKEKTELDTAIKELREMKQSHTQHQATPSSAQPKRLTHPYSQPFRSGTNETNRWIFVPKK